MVTQSDRSTQKRPVHWEMLIERVAGGEANAMADLYDATSHIVYGLAYRILGDPAGAEDVLLDVYTRVWRCAADFSVERGSASAWLFTLTRSRAVDVLRARQRNRATEQLEAANGVAADAPGPEDTSLAAERHRFIARALGALAAEQREAIELAYFAGLSHSEIAARLGQPLGTVKTRIRLGMTRLRELLAPLASAANRMDQGRTA
jgi:RNA polymerase sigma-70 factor (ECF subfamily)